MRHVLLVRVDACETELELIGKAVFGGGIGGWCVFHGRTAAARRAKPSRATKLSLGRAIYSVLPGVTK